MNFLRHIVGGATSEKVATTGFNRAVATSVPVYYSLSSFRWHTDTRPPVKAVLLHDLFTSGYAWKQSLHEYISSMPMNQLSPTDPLEVYCPDIRGHGLSDGLKIDADTFVETASDDIIALQQVIVGGQSKLGGVGFGAMLACQSALQEPSHFSSLVLFVKDLTTLTRCQPSNYALRDIMLPLQGKEENVSSLDDQLLSKLPDVTQRALVLLNTKVVKTNDGSAGGDSKKIAFRMHDVFLNSNNNLVFSSGALGSNSVFPGETVVFHVDPISETDKKAFKRNFPHSAFSRLKSEDVVSAGSEKLAPLVLHSFGILGQMSPAE